MRFHLRRAVVLGMTAALLSTGLLAGGASASIRDGAYTVRLKDIGIGGGMVASGTVKCPTGQRVVSGGAYVRDPGASPLLTNKFSIRGSAPLPDGTGWRAAMESLEAAGVNRLLTIVATCLPLSSIGPYTMKKTEFAAPIGGTVGGFAACPADYRAVTGGVYWHRVGHGWEPGLAASVGSSGTGDLLTWYATGTTAQLHLRLRVIAMCLPKAKVGNPSVTYVDLFSKYGAGDYLACPPGQRLVAGGAFFHDEGEGVSLYHDRLVASTPRGDAARWWAAGQGFIGVRQLRIAIWCTTPR